MGKRLHRPSAKTPVPVSVRNLNGQAAISFKDIPLAHVDLLTEALTGRLPLLRVVAEGSTSELGRRAGSTQERGVPSCLGAGAHRFSSRQTGTLTSGRL